MIYGLRGSVRPVPGSVGSVGVGGTRQAGDEAAPGGGALLVAVAAVRAVYRRAADAEPQLRPPALDTVHRGGAGGDQDKPRHAGLCAALGRVGVEPAGGLDRAEQGDQVAARAAHRLAHLLQPVDGQHLRVGDAAVGARAVGPAGVLRRAGAGLLLHHAARAGAAGLGRGGAGLCAAAARDGGPAARRRHPLPARQPRGPGELPDGAVDRGGLPHGPAVFHPVLRPRRPRRRRHAGRPARRRRHRRRLLGVCRW